AVLSALSRPGGDEGVLARWQGKFQHLCALVGAEPQRSLGLIDDERLRGHGYPAPRSGGGSGGSGRGLSATASMTDRRSRAIAGGSGCGLSPTASITFWTIAFTRSSPRRPASMRISSRIARSSLLMGPAIVQLSPGREGLLSYLTATVGATRPHAAHWNCLGSTL